MESARYPAARVTPRITLRLTINVARFHEASKVHVYININHANYFQHNRLVRLLHIKTSLSNVVLLCLTGQEISRHLVQLREEFHPPTVVRDKTCSKTME